MSNAAGMDYTSTTRTLTISPADNMACVDIPIIDDNVAMEGTETFNVTITPPPDVPAEDDNPKVTIIDNDGKSISDFLNMTLFLLSLEDITLIFDHRDIIVQENGSANVCFTPDNPSVHPYTITVNHAPSGTKPATRKFLE